MYWWGTWLSKNDNKIVVRPRSNFFKFLNVKNTILVPSGSQAMLLALLSLDLKLKAYGDKEIPEEVDLEDLNIKTKDKANFFNLGPKK